MQIGNKNALKLLLCMVSLGALGVTNAQARVIIKEKVTYYNVTGSNGVEIYRSMEKNGPIHGGSKKEILASTTFKFAVKNVDASIKGNRCVINNVDIVVGVTYTYPRWNGASSASIETRNAWRDFSKHAIVHEKEHVKITKKFAADYEQALLKSRRNASSNCEKRSLSESFRTGIALRKHERLHKMFDRKDLRPGGRAYDALRKLVYSR